jgi:hypothetical protein
MEVFVWFQDNSFDLLQCVGIIGGLLFTAASFRANGKARRVANLIAITHHHREIWTQLYKQPELSRVVKPTVDLRREPVTEGEELFVDLLILHLSSSYHAMREGVFVKPQGLRKDIRWFFALPIPRAVWRKSRVLQDEDFVKFIESNLDTGEFRHGR